MTAERRREQILTVLSESQEPVSATKLASLYDVSRQIIVGDIALLRAAGEEIMATPRGYTMTPSSASGSYRRAVACIHEDPEDMRKELNIMVDNGCTVVDVIVEHVIYGQIIGALDISSRYDVSVFMEKVLTEQAPPLSSLTGGIHVHTLSCDSKETFERTVTELRKAGFLYEENS